MSIRRFFLSVTVVCACLTTHARADLITFTTSGIINFGFDANGFFGAPTTTSGLALVGDTYSLSITFDTAVNVISTDGVNYTELDNPVGGATPGGGIVVATVNGVSKSVPFLAIVVDQLWVRDYLHQGVLGGRDEVFGQVDARDNAIFSPNNNLLNASNQFYSSVADFLTGPGFNQPFSVALTPQYLSSGVHFSFTDNSTGSGVVTVFDGTPTSAELSFASAVSEPETYAMLLAGLGLMNFIGRRRKHKAI
jgi:hypothetical protein